MSEWKEYKLGDIAEILTGYPFKSNEYSATGTLKVVRGENVTIGDLRWDTVKCWEKSISTLGKYLLQKDDIVIGMDGSRVGKNRALVRENQLPLILAQRVARVRAKQNFDQKFVWYLVFEKTFADYVDAIHTGTSIPHISLNQIADFEVVAPPYPLQIKIANIFASLDDKIDLLTRQNKTLEQLAETYFRQWFVEGTHKTKNGVLADFVSETIGGEWGKDEPTEDFVVAVNCIRGTDIGDLENGLAKKMPLRFVKQSKLDKIQPIDGDLIMEISGGTDDQSTGRAIYINEYLRRLFPNPLVFSNFSRLLRLKDKKYMYFVYSYIKHLYGQDEFYNYENGSSGIKNLDYKSIINGHIIQVPNDLSLITKYTQFAQPLFDKIGRNKLQIQKLEGLRDNFLPKLMSGEIETKA